MISPDEFPHPAAEGSACQSASSDATSSAILNGSGVPGTALEPSGRSLETADAGRSTLTPPAWIMPLLLGLTVRAS